MLFKKKNPLGIDESSLKEKKLLAFNANVQGPFFCFFLTLFFLSQSQWYFNLVAVFSPSVCFTSMENQDVNCKERKIKP